MLRFVLRAVGLAAAIVISFFSFAANAQTPPPARDFLWNMRGVQMSPDGNYISMIQPYEGRTALVVYPSGGGEPVVIEGGNRGTTENVEVSTHFWSGDRIVVTVNWNDHYQSTRYNFRTEQSRMLSVLPDGSDIQVLFESRQGVESDFNQQSWVIDRLEDDEDYILVSIFEVAGSTGFRTVSTSEH